MTLKEDEVISVYTDGPFVDLCAARTSQHGEDPAFQAAPRRRRVWRGDERRQMLQRIYGTAWFTNRISISTSRASRKRASAITARSDASSICHVPSLGSRRAVLDGARAAMIQRAERDTSAS